MKNFNLDSIKKDKKEFKIPTNYFEDFEGELLHKWNTSQLANKKKEYRIKKYTYMSIAASITILLGIFFTIKNTANTSINNTDIENYIYTQSPLYYSEIIEELDNEDIKSLEITLIPEKNQIDEYLLYNVDIEYLMEY